MLFYFQLLHRDPWLGDAVDNDLSKYVYLLSVVT